MKNVLELVIVIGLLLILGLIVAGLVADRPVRSGEVTTWRPACMRNLSVIAKACVAYQEGNGEFFPAFWNGDRFDPMISVAMLYPTYVSSPKYFGCPSTKDRPAIDVTLVGRRSLVAPSGL